MATKEKSVALPEGVNADDSPFALQEIAGLPFAKDSEEAKAIRDVIEQANRERARPIDSK